MTEQQFVDLYKANETAKVATPKSLAAALAVCADYLANPLIDKKSAKFLKPINDLTVRTEFIPGICNDQFWTELSANVKTMNLDKYKKAKLPTKHHYSEESLQGLDDYFQGMQKMLDELNGTNGEMPYDLMH